MRIHAQSYPQRGCNVSKRTWANQKIRSSCPKHLTKAQSARSQFTYCCSSEEQSVRPPLQPESIMSHSTDCCSHRGTSMSVFRATHQREKDNEDPEESQHDCVVQVAADTSSGKSEITFTPNENVRPSKTLHPRKDPFERDMIGQSSKQ